MAAAQHSQSRVWSNAIGQPTEEPVETESDERLESSEDDPLLRSTREMDVHVSQSGSWWRNVQGYSVWALFLLLLAYLFNQLDRYMLAITITDIAQELQFGDRSCLPNKSVSQDHVSCNATNSDSCVTILSSNGTAACVWNYNGQGWDYQILAGPVFILIYTFAGIFVGFAADWYNRKLLLAVSLGFWSLMTLLTGFVQEYWQLFIFRFGLGLGEAGCTPFATSLIADYFTKETRATALGIYNFGIYLGYSLSYAIGNFITVADINGQGWRWAFILPAIPGILVAVVIAVTIREPKRSSLKETVVSSSLNNSDNVSGFSRLKILLKAFAQPSLILLCTAGAIRNAGGYVWAYNTQPYFDAIGVSKQTTGSYLSWIPLVSGCFGVLLGGFVSDRLVKNRGLYARIIVLVVSQILAAPFAAGALFLDVPYAFFSLIPANIIGEMWVGVTLTVVVELVPVAVRTSAVGAYLFIISNIGGNIPLLVPPLQSAFSGGASTHADALRNALYILYPGLYLLGGCIFLLTMCAVKRDQRRLEYQQLEE